MSETNLFLAAVAAYSEAAADVAERIGAYADEARCSYVDALRQVGGAVRALWAQGLWVPRGEAQ